MATLLAGVLNSPAAVTPQGWYHFGELQDYYADSSGNNRRFQSAFSTGASGTGNANAVVTSTGVGGPLDGTGWNSTKCLRFGDNGARQAGMWNPGFNPPATNYGLELWVLPEGKGFVGGSGSWLVNAGQVSGSAVIRIMSNGDGTSSFVGTVNGKGDVGDPVVADTTKWTHLAIVNDAGNVSFYVNGVKSGSTYAEKITSANTGDICIGHPGVSAGPLGLLDEVRIFTFDAGKFSTSDFLIPPPGPNIVTQPQSIAVWEGGAAPYAIDTVIDSSNMFQWLRNGVNIKDATQFSYTLPNVTSASDNGVSFSCKVTNPTGSVTSSNATLTVFPVQTENVAAYRSTVTKETSLLAYFPVDKNTGTIVSNQVDSVHNGTLELNASYDGRTNTAFGQRAILINEDGDVSIPANAAFDFASGNGTVEALVYMSHATAANATIFSVASDGAAAIRYAILASKDGAGLICTNDLATLTWAVPVNLIGRQAHVAFVFDNTTNVTAYIDGQSLGTKQQSAFGSGTEQQAWIGSMGTSIPGMWAGTIDELAIYGSALSLTTIQAHYSSFVYGVNIVKPGIVSQSHSKTWFAGGSPKLEVTVTGSLPFNYQWTSNGVAIPGAINSALTLKNTTTNYSATYAVSVSNSAGQTNSEAIVLKFIQPPDDYAKTVMTDNPVSYWRLDETAGPTAVDSAGSNDGVYKSTETFGVPSLITQVTNVAVNLDGGYVEVPYSAALNPNGPFTIEMWAKTSPNYDPNANTYVPISSQGRLGSGRYGWCVYLNNDGSGFEMHMGDASGVAGSTRVSGATAGTANTLYHLAFVYDGTNLQVHVNGKLDFETTGGFPYTANYTAPLEIGCRNDINFNFMGVIDDVAIYGYALTTNQITSHYGYSFVKAQISQQPTNVTDAVEAGNVTLTAVAAGYPNTYQWYKDGVALEASTNPDGSQHYPQGVTGTTLVIGEATPSDSGRYHVVIANPLGNVTTVDATVTVAADKTSPKVAYVTALSSNDLVRVVFDRWITPETASVIANYTLSGGAIVTSANLSSDPSVVVLGVTGLASGTQYTLSVTGVKDQRQSSNLIQANSTSFRTGVLTQGVLAWDYYPNIKGNPVSDLLNDLQYPNAPWTNAWIKEFSTMSITSGDLQNNSAFGTIPWAVASGSLGENYGDRIQGWLTPKETGNYTFFIRSDDGSQLFLSTDDKPDNATMIASEDTAGNPFKEPGDGISEASAPQSLVAGKHYYILALHKEGTGGDYVEVAWRKEGDTNAAPTLKPIPGEFLSAYASLPAPVFGQPVVSSGNITITWSGLGKLQESTDTKTWSDVAGNPASGYTTPATSSKKFYRLVQ